MGNDDRLAMRIRTILVTTRVAVSSNAKIGRADLALESARRGLALLDGIRDHVSPTTAPEMREEYERARRELMGAAGGGEVTGFVIEDEASGTSSPRGGGSTSGSG